MNLIAPFSQNQIAYAQRSEHSWLNVAEGGKRGGKNVLQTLIYCLMLETHPDPMHLIAGVSTATARINILDCDGYGLYNYFEGRYRKGKFENKSCVYIQTKVGEKVIIIAGGGKNGDERFIKGNTYGSVYITEANECAETFIKECFDRTASSHLRKMFFDLNPKAAKHWFYTNILEFHEQAQKLNPKYGYNYGHFTIADNYSIDNKRLREILATYDKNSVWYQRDIKGLRVSADGLIYYLFANNTKKYLIDKLMANITNIVIGVDFGGNGSQHAFVATAYTPYYKQVIVLASRRVPAANTTSIDLQKAFIDFCSIIFTAYHKPMECRADSAEQVLKNDLQMAIVNARLPIVVRNAMKRPIRDRIRLENVLLATGRLKFLSHTTLSLQEAMATAVWDKNEFDDVRLDDGTSDIDSLDAFEYTLEPFMRELIEVQVI